MLTVLDHLPAGLPDADVTALAELLGGPTLIHLPGRRPRPLFVSVLLHGNETGGFHALQRLLRDYAGREWPRALSVFIGNVAAARHGMRRLDGQADYNRVWPGAEGGGTPEHAMMAQVVREMRAREVFASIDIHNNTGFNPHYACLNRTEPPFLHLATLFSRTVVYFTRPLGVQSMAFASLCPAVTLECGQIGQDHGIEHAREFIDAALHLAELPVHAVAAHDLDLFHTVAVVKVPESVSVSFDGSVADIEFIADLDRLNFRELPEGTGLARVNTVPSVSLEAWDEMGREVGADYFAIAGNELRVRRPVMPSMLSRDARVVRQDCLGYLMERYLLPDRA